MKIKKLTLDNFMAFGNAQIDWSDNINIICGENSTGKTTLLKVMYSLKMCIRDRYGRIKFTVNGLNTLATDVTNTMTINSKIDLGNYTEITAGNNLTIQALVERIYAYAEAYSETGAIINTPVSYTHLDVYKRQHSIRPTFTQSQSPVLAVLPQASVLQP